ncbi:MAG: tetratricopeptide repeat protein [Myxococcota bacterium]
MDEESYAASAKRRPIRALFLAALLLVNMSGLACESQPVRAIRGGRLYVSGTEALDRGDATAAIAQLEAAADLVPGASEIRNHLGLAYWSAGDPERAREAFEIALDLDCDNEAARTNLARLEANEAGRTLEQRDD